MGSSFLSRDRTHHTPMLSLSCDPQLPHSSALPRDQSKRDIAPDFLQGSFTGPLLGVTSQGQFCSLLLRKIWHLSQILWPPVPLEPSSQTSGKHFWGAPSHPCSEQHQARVPNQAPSETHSFLDGNQARINSPSSAPNHNLGKASRSFFES